MTNADIDLRSDINESCFKCGKKKRKLNTKDGVCKKITSCLDELPVRCVGAWAYEKIYRLINYFGIFSTGMKKKWNKLNYVEICSGPGRCITKNNGEEIDGTALSIINHLGIEYVTKAIFIDNNDEVVNTLNTRIEQLGKDDIAEAILGDYNESDEIVNLIEKKLEGGLTCLFIDPTDCSIPFFLIEKLKKFIHNCDLIINIAMGTDIRRNISNAILDSSYANTREKYIKFLGSNKYFENSEVIEYAKQGNKKKLSRMFIEEYKKNLDNIGLKYTDIKTVKHYYYLLFASESKKGLEFWEKANKIEPNKQRNFF